MTPQKCFYIKNLVYLHLLSTVPCCPKLTSVSAVSWETLMIEWSPVRGADLYETRAVDATETILCNDTAPSCALSDLTCNSRYSVVVIPCNDVSGCNLTCSPQTHETGILTYLDPEYMPQMHTVHTLSLFLFAKKLHARLRSSAWARVTRLLCWLTGLLLTLLPTTPSLWLA